MNPEPNEGEMPDVRVTGGTMPEFDVETADVNVGTKETAVEVPTVDVTMPDDAKDEPVTGDE